MKIAIVHESLTRFGGAERVLLELRRAFPEARIYALLKRDAVIREFFPGVEIKYSFLGRAPEFLRRHERLFLPLLPVAPETFDLSGFDVVISSASAFAKGVVTRPGTLHICYCHSPTRYLWDWHQRIMDENPGRLKHFFLAGLMHYLRIWDQSAAKRTDVFVANSEYTRARIRKYYRREAATIYPPVDIERFLATPRKKGEYFLFIGRLSKYKGAATVVSAFNKLELPLVVAGEGREEKRLRAMADKNVKFRGFVPDKDLPALFASARAVIFPSEDDFGIVPVEAMAAGVPVLALRRGGARETLAEGITGEFYDEQHEAYLAECVRLFLEKEGSYGEGAIRSRARRFSTAVFRAEIKRFVETEWRRYRM